jgi:GH25 family lysozyme M1 (1,4-beta-N-acetylmuramidase)
MVDIAQNIMIDVSGNDGIIDFSRLVTAFPNGAVIQIKATQGTSYINSQFYPCLAAALKLGWGIMPYHFCNSEDATAQWDHFQSVAKLQTGEAYMLDWERYEGDAASVPQMEAMGHLGMSVTGRVPMGYWGDPGLGSSPATPSTFMQTWDWQCPRYRRANDPDFYSQDPRPAWNGKEAVAYQYTCWGRLPGIQNGVGDVDRSVLYAPSLADAIAYCKR